MRLSGEYLDGGDVMERLVERLEMCWLALEKIAEELRYRDSTISVEVEDVAIELGSIVRELREMYCYT
jgi:hypothetical protein